MSYNNFSNRQKSSSVPHRFLSDMETGRKQMYQLIDKRRIGINDKLLPLSRSKIRQQQLTTKKQAKRTIDTYYHNIPSDLQIRISSRKGLIKNKNYSINQILDNRQDYYIKDRKYALQNHFNGTQADFYKIKNRFNRNESLFDPYYLQIKRRRPIWELQSQKYKNYENPRVNKKLYRIKKKKIRTETSQQLMSNQEQNVPILHKVMKVRNPRRKIYDQVMTNQPEIYRYMPTQITKKNYFQQQRQFKQKRIMNTYKSFRKVVHSVLFTIYLRKFNQRMRIDRQYKFNKFLKSNFQQSLLTLKGYFIQSMKPFFLVLADQQNLDYRIHDKDDFILRKEKLSYVEKIMQIIGECMESCFRKIMHTQQTIKLLYYLCKHGSYSSMQAIFTAEQLASACLSETYGYMSCDKYLQMSLILYIVLIKIMLFNILFKPQKIYFFSDQVYNKGLILSNIKLFGNILYEIMIDIQDSLLQKCSNIYVISNWVKIRNKFKIQMASSMTVKKKFIQQNQLISGLQNHNLIRQVYHTNQMKSTRKLIQQNLNVLQKYIAEYHKQIRESFF